jgi:molybdopterin synthase sulfur carrier subunit
MPSSLRRLTGSAVIVEAQAATVADLIDRLEARFPGFRERVCEPDGVVKRHMRVFVNGADVRDLNDVQTALAPDDDVLFAAAMAGGMGVRSADPVLWTEEAARGRRG